MENGTSLDYLLIRRQTKPHTSGLKFPEFVTLSACWDYFFMFLLNSMKSFKTEEACFFKAVISLCSLDSEAIIAHTKYFQKNCVYILGKW